MALSRSERFKLKSGIRDEMQRDDESWDFTKQNMLLREFGLQTMSPYNNGGPEFEDLIADLPDADLVEMYAVVTGVEQGEVRDVVEATESGNWKPGYVRLFISHSATHKEFVGKVADELAVVGIHGFVAHDTMQVSKPWQDQIEQALRSMDAFVAIVHPEFNKSGWCHQEVGWALGRRVPRYVVRMGDDPAGFIGREQWPSETWTDSRGVASVISNWIATEPMLGDTMTASLFNALESAPDYMTAGTAADRIARLNHLTADQWDRLDEVYWDNDQVYGGVLAGKALGPFYRTNGREFPPPRPAPPAPATNDPWATSNDEPPF